MIKLPTQELIQRLEDSAVALLAGQNLTLMEVNLIVPKIFVAASYIYDTHSLSHGHRVSLCTTIHSRLREK